MSDKKRRDITLGEMQDECKSRRGHCDGCGYSDICDTMFDETLRENGDEQNEWSSPIAWDLTDPPRFDERQMELLKGLYAVGARKMIYHPDADHRWIKFEREDRTMIACVEMSALGYEDVSGAYEHGLLAELFGKEGA